MSDVYVKCGGVVIGCCCNVVVFVMLMGVVIFVVLFMINLIVLFVVFLIMLMGIVFIMLLNFVFLNDLFLSLCDVGKVMVFVVVGGNIFGLIVLIVMGYVIVVIGSYDWVFGIVGMLFVVGVVIMLIMMCWLMIYV